MSWPEKKAISAAPTRAPTRPASAAPLHPVRKRKAPGEPRPDASASAIAPLAVPLDRGARDHRDILSAQPVGRAGGQAEQSMLGIGQSEPRLCLEIVAL